MVYYFKIPGPLELVVRAGAEQAVKLVMLAWDVRYPT